ncbi:hypothetical protein ACFBZI_00835 [Moraxella sp. ZJ142]|uniref:hypothetical protein n=1 Tax=Moraxella marmotae TaxID=3344520 RepID=UPI0035D50103
MCKINKDKTENFLEPQLDADPSRIELTAADGELLQQLLDNPPPLSPVLRDLLSTNKQERPKDTPVHLSKIVD